MGKIILWIIVVFAILFVLRVLNVAKANRARSRGKTSQSEAKSDAAMVRCIGCGVFLPKSDALPSPQGFRCGDPACSSRHGNAR